MNRHFVHWVAVGTMGLTTFAPMRMHAQTFSRWSHAGDGVESRHEPDIH